MLTLLMMIALGFSAQDIMLNTPRPTRPARIHAIVTVVNDPPGPVYTTRSLGTAR
jgi:hypothetical protein